MAGNIAYVSLMPGSTGTGAGFGPGLLGGAVVPVAFAVLDPENVLVQDVNYPNPSYFNAEVNYGATAQSVYEAVVTFLRVLTGDPELTAVVL